MNITIIGAGYVGLVSGVCFAHLGHKVLAVDRDKSKIKMLEQGVSPIYEPHLTERLQEHFREGRIAFTTSISEGVKHGEIIFLAVDTPGKPSGEADLSAVEQVCQEIAKSIKDYRVIVEKSTVPVKTGEWVAKTINKYINPGVCFDVASNPEFLREGSAIDDFLHPDRVVIGTTSDRAAALLTKLYEPLNAPLLLCDINSAELIKHCANAFLAMKISFINSVAQICELSGADVKRVARGIGLDRRIGMEFLNAGVGYGGSCFPKDVAAFIKIAEQLNYDYGLLKEVSKINEEQKKLFVRKLEKALGSLSGKKAGILGLTFKPNTDDLRGAPALDIIKILLKKGMKLKAYDPVGMEKTRQLIPELKTAKNPYDTAKNADALLILTDWPEFYHLNLLEIKQLMHQPLIIDGRNIYEPGRMKELGFKYYGMGR